MMAGCYSKLFDLSGYCRLLGPALSLALKNIRFGRSAKDHPIFFGAATHFNAG
jgi:hypothetical protein